MNDLSFKKEPGQMPSAELDGGVATLVGDPDWVRLPSQLGGNRERVQEIFSNPCPGCESGHPVTHYKLETLSVAECPTRGFLWYRPRK